MYIKFCITSRTSYIIFPLLQTRMNVQAERLTSTLFYDKIQFFVVEISKFQNSLLQYSPNFSLYFFLPKNLPLTVISQYTSLSLHFLPAKNLTFIVTSQYYFNRVIGRPAAPATIQTRYYSYERAKRNIDPRKGSGISSALQLGSIPTASARSQVRNEAQAFIPAGD